MHTAGFEAAIPSSQRRQTQALNRAAIQSIFWHAYLTLPNFVADSVFHYLAANIDEDVLNNFLCKEMESQRRNFVLLACFV